MTGFANVQFKEGDVLFSAGDAADKLYIIEKGTVQLLDSQSSHAFPNVTQGEAFGEQCILSNGVRSATATALENTECIAIDGAGLRQLLVAQSPLMTSLFEALLLQLHMHNTLLR